MLYVIIGFLWFSLLIYLIMGGADFGAGILELVSGEKQRSEIRKAAYRIMGPIWEANHMWLIIAIVILFVAFPEVYTTLSISLHIPIVLMLTGIIGRGTSFAFRNYDAVSDHWQEVYNNIFMYSSFVTPFFLGVVASSAVAGTIDPNAGYFSSAYIFSWLSGFALSTGLFTVSLCAFLAAVYLSGEDQNSETKFILIRKVKHTHIAVVICIFLVFFSAYIEDIPLITWVFGNGISLLAVFISLLSWFLIWKNIHSGKRIIVRFLAVLSVTGFLIAATYSHYPNVVLMKENQVISLTSKPASLKTLKVLGTTLLFGSFLILPALFYLVLSFERKVSQIK